MNYNYNNLKEDEHVFHMWEVMNFNITDKYKFIKRNFIFNLISNIIFIPIGILLYIINKVLFGFEVIDKRKIIKDSGFVSVSNHIHPMDCTMIGLIYYPKRVYYPTIERNFKIPFIRHLIRLLYAFPIPQNKKYKDNFYKDINNALNNNKIIQMYPEGSMWPYYENVRHFKTGAFKMAVDANKPIQPIKFLFEENNGIYSLYKKKKCIVAKVLDPIYPNNNLEYSLRIEDLKERCYKIIKEAK
ncbi:MAG: 1-acyl-sn-glycerol-3-phosphate acyltransferase [Bacillales bacterium]|nr:1-acyl-sn-glycerol-3-phosphate acyltransferase [Bacillales bacterium]